MMFQLLFSSEENFLVKSGMKLFPIFCIKNPEKFPEITNLILSIQYISVQDVDGEFFFRFENQKKITRNYIYEWKMFPEIKSLHAKL